MVDSSIVHQSAIRHQVLDSKKYFSQPTTGQSAMRFMVPKSVARSDSIMSAAVQDDVHMISWKGNGKRILAYPVDYDRQFNVTCSYPSHLSNKQASDDKSAAVVGMYTPALAPLSACTKVTYHPVQHTIRRYPSTTLSASIVILIPLQNASFRLPTRMALECGSCKIWKTTLTGA